MPFISLFIQDFVVLINKFHKWEFRLEDGTYLRASSTLLPMRVELTLGEETTFRTYTLRGDLCHYEFDWPSDTTVAQVTHQISTALEDVIESATYVLYLESLSTEQGG